MVMWETTAQLPGWQSSHESFEMFKIIGANQDSGHANISRTGFSELYMLLNPVKGQ